MPTVSHVGKMSTCASVVIGDIQWGVGWAVWGGRLVPEPQCLLFLTGGVGGGGGGGIHD